MFPPAPERFSTTTCWPSSSESAGAMMRAVVSVPPPGSKPTTVVTGLLGKLCANALTEKASAATAASCFIPSSSLSALENGLSLFHEGSSAFTVILAVEALFDPRRAGLGVVLRRRHLADDSFRRAHGEWSVGRDHFAIIARRLLQLRHGHHLVHEAHTQRLLGVELACGNHDFARIGGADDVDQVLHRARAIAEAHLRRRNAEAGVVGGDAQVAEV